MDELFVSVTSVFDQSLCTSRNPEMLCCCSACAREGMFESASIALTAQQMHLNPWGKTEI
jgi:hypothetical protein